MSKRSPRKKKKTVAKVHRVTRRHHKEMELTHYARALDKIYTKIEMAQMVPQVVQLMRREYHENPHELYLLVCKKYGITPEEKFDVDLLVYGKGKPKKKHKLEQNSDKEQVGESKEPDLEKKNEEMIKVTTNKPEDKLDEVTDNKEVNQKDTVKPLEEIEEKKEDLHGVNKETQSELKLWIESELGYQGESKREREIVTETPRTVQAVERMYQTRAANQNASQGGAADERRLSQRTLPTEGYQQRTSPTAVTQNRIEYVRIYPGDICETMVLTKADKFEETGFWIPARVITIDTEKESIDLEVLQPVKYGLSKNARNVPYRYVRSPSEITWEY